jgi:RHS repeat-associated protein
MARFVVGVPLILRSLLRKLILPLVLLTSTLGFSQSGNQPTSPVVGNVALDTLNVTVSVPVFNKAGVGSPFSASVIFNNNNLSPTASTTWSDRGTWNTDKWIGGIFTSDTRECKGTDGSVQSYFGYTDRQGTYHQIPEIDISVGGGSKNGCTTYDTYSQLLLDGSGITVNLSSNPANNTAVLPDGTILRPLNMTTGILSATDTNGNAITLDANNSKMIDTLGAQVLTYTNQGLCVTGVSTTTLTYPTSTGTASVTINCSQHTIKTNFGCPTTTQEANYTEWLADSIVLGDGSSTYSFGYESQIAGSTTTRLSSITYPNGAVVTYGYPGSYHGIDCENGTTTGLTVTTADGTTTYTRSGYPSYLVDTVVSPAPANNTTVYTFVLTGTYWDPANPMILVQEVVKQGASTVLKTVNYCYNGNQSNCLTTVPSMPLTQKDAYSTLAGMGTSSRTTVIFDNYSNVTETDAYDFGASTPTFKTQYLNYGKSWNGSISSPSFSTIGNNVKNVPGQIKSFDINGNPIGNTFFSYNSHGNLLTSSKWVSGSIIAGQYLATTFVRNSNGTASSTTDANGVQTTLSYANCGGLLSASTNVPTTLSSSMVMDCNGTVATSMTGMDGNASYSAYNDPLWRRTSSTNAWGTVTNYYPTATSGESVTTFNGGSSVADTYALVDPAHSSSIVQNVEGPGGSWDTVWSKASWDSTGILNTALPPCITTKGSNCTTGTSATVTHDALGRALVSADSGGGTVTNVYSGRDVTTTVGPAPAGEVVKVIQTEYDGLGRVKSVCNLSSASGSMSCGQDAGGTGFLTVHNYNADGSVASIQKESSTQTQTRSFTYNVAGRVLTATYPESGTVQYFYDVAPSTPGVACSPNTVYGKLVKTYDANGNTTCYNYDGLYRVTSVTFSGPNADGNNKYFVYDSATVNNVTMTGTLSRLAEAYTAPSAGGTKVTDEGFTYDVLGRTTDVYQKTPHSPSAYYHSTVSYFENGALHVLTIPGSGNTFTYGIDGKGRPYSAVQASTALVNSVTYNVVDRPCVLSLGLGDSDTYGYDNVACTGQLSTGRMSSYTFSVGATPKTDVGNLTWNANGTLRQLAITDGFNSSGTQTCNYGTPSTAGYDELGRLVSVNCGSAWSQTFTYDPFNNITKSGSSSWLPGYDQTNNHYQNGSTYDANGDLLTDTFHTYQWNQYGTVSAITDASTSLVYDALGRMVEKNVNGTITEVVYGPVGREETMNGSTVVKWLIPLPGGAKAESGIELWHSDWLGSVRLSSMLLNRAYFSDKAFAPYGESYKVFGSADGNEFTDDLQDDVTGTYDTLNRELNPSQGRWLTPDPAHSGWNAYAYSLNPLGTTDPFGLANTDCRITDCHPGLLGGRVGDYGWSGANNNNPDSLCNVDGLATDCGQVDNSPIGEGLTRYLNSIPGYKVMGGELYVSFSFEGKPYWADGMWHFPSTRVNVDLGPVASTNAANPADNLGGYDWGVFWNGVIHGVRQPGQSFKDCVVQNANETTGGAVNKATAVGVAAIAAGTAALGSLRYLPSPSVFMNGIQQASQNVFGATVSSNFARSAGGYIAGLLGAGFSGMRLGASALEALSTGGAYTATGIAGGVIGLTIGSAINCR